MPTMAPTQIPASRPAHWVVVLNMSPNESLATHITTQIITSRDIARRSFAVTNSDCDAGNARRRHSTAATAASATTACRRNADATCSARRAVPRGCQRTAPDTDARRIARGRRTVVRVVWVLRTNTHCVVAPTALTVEELGRAREAVAMVGIGRPADLQAICRAIRNVLRAFRRAARGVGPRLGALEPPELRAVSSDTAGRPHRG